MHSTHFESFGGNHTVGQKPGVVYGPRLGQHHTAIAPLPLYLEPYYAKHTHGSRRAHIYIYMRCVYYPNVIPQIEVCATPNTTQTGRPYPRTATTIHAQRIDKAKNDMCMLYTVINKSIVLFWYFYIFMYSSHTHLNKKQINVVWLVKAV